MPNLLIRDVPETAVHSLTAAAHRAGLSRNEYLRRHLISSAHAVEAHHASRGTTLDDLKRAGAAAAGLLDRDLMDQAWRSPNG